jgi:hypothetical protein
MRRLLLVAALMLVPCAAQAQHPRSHLWIYSNPYTGHSGRGFGNGYNSVQYGVSPRQERFIYVAPAYPAYNYGNGAFYGGFQGGFNPNPWGYGGFGGGY